ncbi:MAG: nucleoside deaminase [Gemmatimonadetes bacterium]|nr:nucleoside deaminase [Gemmatimonadota bacterium]
MDKTYFMRRAIALSLDMMRAGRGGPFGAIVVKDNQIIGEGYNKVTSTQDPTAHAEIVAIREACRTLGSFSLSGCEIYTSCEPCPMCLSAIYWARLERLYFANTRTDAAAIGFDDEKIYKEIGKPLADQRIPTTQLLAEEGTAAFREWEDKADKVPY